MCVCVNTRTDDGCLRGEEEEFGYGRRIRLPYERKGKEGFQRGEKDVCGRCFDAQVETKSGHIIKVR